MPLLRPRDNDALRAEMRHVASVAGAPIMFGGEVHDDTLLLTKFLGTRTAGLRGLAVRPSAGLGGATVVARRPMSVADYRRASTITHDYNAPVLGEGIRSILAVPVVVEWQGPGRALRRLSGRGAGRRPHGGCDGGFRAAIEPRAAVRDEVDRRLRLREAQLANFGGGVANTEKLREVHAELRRLAADTTATPAVRGQLRDLAERLAGAMSPDAPTSCSPLTSREVDVLSQVALGCTNAEAAQRLSLRPETVKSYLRSAAAKLGTRTRHEAVSVARRSRLLP